VRVNAFALQLLLLDPVLVFLVWRWEGWRSPLFGLVLLSCAEPIGYLAQLWRWGPLTLRYHGGDFGHIPDCTLAIIVVVALCRDPTAPSLTTRQLRRLRLMAFPLALACLFGFVAHIFSFHGVKQLHDSAQVFEITQMLSTPIIVFLLRGWRQAPITTLTDTKVLGFALVVSVGTSCAAEVSQRFGFLPGTWDPLDLAAYGIGAIFTVGLLAANIWYLRRRYVVRLSAA
jgi:hypothetical protein